MRVLHDLTRLKAAHPDRVHLVLGNRDINKMRFLHELSSGRVAQGLRAHPGTYWVNGHRARNGKPPDTPAAFREAARAAAAAAAGGGGGGGSLPPSTTKA